jgi:hypothetical protein
MVRQLILLACLAAIAGCGGSSPSASRPASTPTSAPAAEAPTVVFFQRQGAAGATFDTITIRDDGDVTLQKRYGGAGGRFTDLRLHDGQLAALRQELARLPGGATLTRGSPPPGGANYLLRLHGRTITARQGAIAPAARPAIRRLDGYIDGIGVREIKTRTRTHRP